MWIWPLYLHVNQKSDDDDDDDGLDIKATEVLVHKEIIVIVLRFAETKVHGFAIVDTFKVIKFVDLSCFAVIPL